MLYNNTDITPIKEEQLAEDFHDEKLNNILERYFDVKDLLLWGILDFTRLI